MVNVVMSGSVKVPLTANNHFYQTFKSQVRGWERKQKQNKAKTKTKTKQTAKQNKKPNKTKTTK
jgi:hypothetical protein